MSNFDDVAFAALALTSVSRITFIGAFLAIAAVAAAAHGRNRVGHESHLASVLFDRASDVALVLHAGASHATGLDFAAVGNVFAQHSRIFVVDVLSVVLAELAVLTARLLGVFQPLISSFRTVSIID